MAQKEKKESKKAQKTSVKPVEMEKKKDGTIVLNFTVPWSEVEKQRNDIIDKLAKNVEVKGFRKGNVPRDIAEAKLSKEAVKEELLRSILSKKYADKIVELKLRPILSPRIHVEAFDEGTDLVFTAETCEEPEISLGNYKDAIKKVTSKSKIIVPGQEEKKPKIEDIVMALLGEVKSEMPKVLVDHEAERLLSQLLDEVKSLGLTLEGYLSSKGLTTEKLKEEYEKRAENDLKLEFSLRKIADEEKITVEKEDIEKALGTISDEKQKQELLQNPYLVASVIRQQKTIEFLSKI